MAQRDLLTQLTLDAEGVAQAIERRNASVVQARNKGSYTWRQIAAAAGMTELGVRKIYERTIEQKVR